MSSSVFPLALKSSAFKQGEHIPPKYTCSSLDYSPPLEWSDIPLNTESFALICEDPDAPFGIWVHWVIFNIPKDTTHLDENIPKVSHLSKGIIQGINDFGKFGYGGPCPPAGKPHRYFFKLYALDGKIDLKGKVTREKLLSVIKNHILEETYLIGIYGR